jgi:DNA-binding transcriptional MocR family regulator
VVELPPGVDALQLHDQALHWRIVVGLFSARQRFTNFIRISAGAPWSERIAEGLRTLARLIATEVTRAARRDARRKHPGVSRCR